MSVRDHEFSEGQRSFQRYLGSCPNPQRQAQQALGALTAPCIVLDPLLH